MAVLVLTIPLVSFPSPEPDTSSGLTESYKKAIAQRARRKQERREVQRHGYASTLLQVIRHDGVSAFIAYVRVKLQIERSLDHEPIYYKASVEYPADPSSALLRSYTLDSGPTYMTLAEDWTFPEDPWKKEE